MCLWEVWLNFQMTPFTGRELWLETADGGKTPSPRKKLVSAPLRYQKRLLDSLWY